MIEKTFGCVRFYWNMALELKPKALENKEKIPQVLPAHLKKDYPFLKEVDSLALANAQLQLEKAIKNWLKDKTHKKPKLGWVKAKLHREFSGLIKSATVRKTKTGKYFVSVLVEEEIKPKERVHKVCAIDLGLKDYVVIVDSNGNVEKVENPKYIKRVEKKIVKEQRKLSRKKEGYKNYEKQRIKLAKLYERLVNQREDFLHKLSKRIIDENQVVILEDLNVRGLLSNSNLAKHISDSSWSKFVQYLSYKAQWYGRELMFVDRFFPSSKICSFCGYKNDALTLKDREWTCPICQTKHDRDVNASKNLLNYGLTRLKGGRDGTARTYACGGASSSDEAGSSIFYKME